MQQCRNSRNIKRLKKGWLGQPVAAISIWTNKGQTVKQQ